MYANLKGVTDGVVLALDVANPKSYPRSGTSWNDLSGNGNNGTLTNGPTFNSDAGGSIVFDGTDDYVSTSYLLNGANSLTVSCWFKLDTVTKNFQAVVDAYKDATDRNFQMWINSDSKLYIYHLGAAHTGDGLLVINRWYNAVFTYSGSGNGVLYLNGSIINASVPKGAGVGGNINVGIGRRADANASSYTDGNVSQVLIYNRSLSAQEVLQNFNATRSRYGI